MSTFQWYTGPAPARGPRVLKTPPFKFVSFLDGPKATRKILLHYLDDHSEPCQPGCKLCKVNGQDNLRWAAFAPVMASEKIELHNPHRQRWIPGVFRITWGVHELADMDLRGKVLEISRANPAIKNSSLVYTLTNHAAPQGMPFDVEPTLLAAWGLFDLRGASKRARAQEREGNNVH